MKTLDRTELRRVATEAAVVAAASGITGQGFRVEAPLELLRHIGTFDPPMVLQLLDSIDQVLELCDEWDALSKGPTPTTTRIRAAIDGTSS